MGQELKKEPLTDLSPPILGPGEGVGGGVNPSPKGKEGILEVYYMPPLNHLRPKGWWDYTPLDNNTLVNNSTR